VATFLGMPLEVFAEALARSIDAAR
jgi:hypothetical protein